MSAHKSETTLLEDGRLTLEGLPFRAGERVEVIVMPKPSLPLTGPNGPYPLKGTIVRYDEPTNPVAVDDWEALK
jgi:hypothetical protein